MSCNYADGLSKYDDKGVCGLKEIYDELPVFDDKVEQLANMIKEAKHVVVHTGAGISTSAGIPDFRGPKGVWTLEKEGLKPNISISFNEAKPTVTHMALNAMLDAGMIHFIVSQNVDGLHLRSNVLPDKLAELHGNMFLDKCDLCERLFIRRSATETVGQKFSGTYCPLPKKNGRRCRGKLHDTILDWEDELPLRDLELAEINSRKADLSICLGTTLQIIPSGNLPVLTKKSKGKLVIVNLQPTKHDKHADIIIHGYVDDVMVKLAKHLNIDIPEYKVAHDPTKNVSGKAIEYIASKPPEQVHVAVKRDIRLVKEDVEVKEELKNKPPEQEYVAVKKDINFVKEEIKEAKDNCAEQVAVEVKKDVHFEEEKIELKDLNNKPSEKIDVLVEKDVEMKEDLNCKSLEKVDVPFEKDVEMKDELENNPSEKVHAVKENIHSAKKDVDMREVKNQTEQVDIALEKDIHFVKEDLERKSELPCLMESNSQKEENMFFENKDIQCAT